MQTGPRSWETFSFAFGDLKVRLAKHSHFHMKKMPTLAHVITQLHLQAILRRVGRDPVAWMFARKESLLTPGP